MLYTENSLEESYSTVEMQSVYSAAPADWAKGYLLRWWGLTPLQRYSRCILQPQSTGPTRSECSKCNILTSDSAEQSNKKYTSVNNRCLRSKISGDNLDCGRVELSADATLTWTIPGGNTPQDTNCTATCLLSRKLFKLDEPDMQDTAGEAGTNS